MKSFLKKIIVNFICVILTTILLTPTIVYLKKINPVIIDKRDKKLELINDIEVGFFGDSHIKGGIDPIIFSEKTGLKSFTFASSGKPLYFSSLEIKKSLDINPNMTIVLDLGSNNQPFFGPFNYLQGGLYSLNGFKGNISMYSYLLNFDGLFRFVHIDFFNTVQSFLKGTFFDLSFIMFPGKGLNPSNYDENYQQNLNSLKEEIEISSKKNHVLNKNFEVNQLLSVIKSNPNSTFIIIRPPESSIAKNIYPQKNYDDIISKIKGFNNVTYRDFSDFELNYSKDFNDLTHLSKNGMRKFTVEFTNYFNNLNP